MRLRAFGLIIAAALFCTTAPAKSDHVKLRPSSSCWPSGKRCERVLVTHLSAGRKLTAVGDTLYLLDARNRILWQWSTDGPAFTDAPIIDSTGTIYVIAYDLVWAALDSVNGQVKWQRSVSGRATFSQIRLYMHKLYFVVTDMRAYRDTLHPMVENQLQLCKGNAILWEAQIPQGARIKITGNNVFVRYRRKHRVVQKHLEVPKDFGKPIRTLGLLP